MFSQFITALKTSSALKAWLGSGVLHVAVVSVLVATGGLLDRAEIGVRSGRLRVEVLLAPPAQSGSTDAAEASPAVFVTPDRAQIAERHFTNVPTSIGRPVDFSLPNEIAMPEFETANRAEIAQDVPQIEQALPPAASPRRRLRAGSVETAVGAFSSRGESGIEGQTAPSFENNSPPTYPPAAAAAGIEGTVLLSFRVTTSGRVVDVEVAESSGHPILDGAAVNAVKQWRGRPARKHGIPVETTEVQQFHFQLR